MKVQITVALDEDIHLFSNGPVTQQFEANNRQILSFLFLTVCWINNTLQFQMLVAISVFIVPPPSPVQALISHQNSFIFF